MVVVTAMDLGEDDRRRLIGGVERVIAKGAGEEFVHEVAAAVAGCLERRDA
ncbi:MAG: hypothetical protein HYU41_28775 [Candidatus Rokubacteria bacterium]|nr:hypothetical protein [Candidatus Rokubacteria bacterium]